MKKGKIVIKEKVYFEYYELDKPACLAYEELYNIRLDSEYYNEIIKEYEASKQIVEVSNIKKVSYLYFFYFGDTVIMHPDYQLKNNTFCKAKVKDNKAVIIELS